MTDQNTQNGMPSDSPIERVSLGLTLRRIKIDYQRVCELMRGTSLTRRLFWLLSPNVVSLGLYRLSHFFFTNHMRFVAWPIYLFNNYLTGADIPPSTVIGERCFLGHAAGTVICGVVGKDALMFCSPVIGGGMGIPEGCRPSNGLPIIGDGVMIGARAMVLGPIFIGDGATIGAGAIVVKDMQPNATVICRPPQFIQTLKRGVDYDSIAGLK